MRFCFQTLDFTKDQKFLSEFSFHQQKNRLQFPVVTCSAVYYDLQANQDGQALLLFNVTKYDSRFVVLFFTEARDEGATNTHALNYDRFRFPKCLKSFDVLCDNKTVINGPVESLGETSNHWSKIAFFREQMKYRTFKSTFREFFHDGNCDQYVVVDLTALRVSAISRGVPIPTLEIKILWQPNSTVARKLHLHSLQEHVLKLGTASKVATIDFV